MSAPFNIQSLPKDVLRYIFSFLDLNEMRQCFRVNKHFYDATQNVSFLFSLLKRVMLPSNIKPVLLGNSLDIVKGLIQYFYSVYPKAVRPSVALKNVKRFQPLQGFSVFETPFYQNLYGDLQRRDLEIILSNVTLQEFIHRKRKGVFHLSISIDPEHLEHLKLLFMDNYISSWFTNLTIHRRCIFSCSGALIPREKFYDVFKSKTPFKCQFSFIYPRHANDIKVTSVIFD